MRTSLHIILFSVLAIFILTGCGGTTIPTNPIKEMKKQFADKYAYTIVLEDMDLINKKQYAQRYKIFDISKDGSVKVETTEWQNVDDDFFRLHETDLGMEIFSKLPDGNYNNLVAPPGFTLFIGNPQYGEWKTADLTQTDTNSLDLLNEPVNDYPTWHFFPAYAFLEDALELKGLEVTQQEYEAYQNGYFLNRPYYGEKVAQDKTKYGTSSLHWFYIRPLFFTRKKEKDNFNKPRSFTSFGGNRGGGGFGK